MKSSRLFAVVAVLSFVSACENKAPTEDPSTFRESLEAKSKAQISMGMDGGVGAKAAAATQTVQPPTIPYTATVTTTETGTGTVTGVGSIVTKTTTGTVTNTATRTATATKTVSATGVVTATFTGTKTGTLTSSGTKTATKTATGTASWTGTYLGTGTATGTKTLTGTLTGTATLTGTLSITATGTKTNTGTKSATGTAVGTGSGTATLTFTAVPTTTATSTATTTGTNTATVTKIGTVVTSATGTSLTTATNLCYGTWAFCDNFETGNGSGWSVQQGPVQNFAVVGDGTKVYRENDPTASQLYISRAQVGMAWLDATAEASLKPLTFSSSSATVSLWGRYDATWNADCGYYVSLRGDGKVALGKRVIGVNTAIGSPVAVPGGISTGTWYDVKLDMQGTTLKAYVNGSLLLTQTDGSCTSGSVGVGSVGASFESDDVRVSAPTTNACVQNWAGTQCGAFCTYEATLPSQSDRAGCGVYLDCYATHGCSPETCGGQDDVCGVNRLNPWGTASKEVADQVYKCMGCSGSVNCANPRYYNGTVCADGNPCTWGDTCQNKVCVPDPNRNTQCSAADQCHGVGTCDTGTGICNNPSKPDDAVCDDSNACTPSSVCKSGICTGENPVTCTASDQCHVGVCDPANGSCSEQAKADGSSCNDDNACTNNDTCLSGACTGGTAVTCPADDCHTPGTCDTSTGTCSDPTPVDKMGCNVNLRYDGFVDNPDGTFTAIFGHNSTATTNFHPGSNKVFINGVLQNNPQPPPPYDLAPGTHPGSFLATFTADQTLQWVVDGQTKTADSTDQTQKKTATVIGTGKGVDLGGGVVVMLKPDLSPYMTTPHAPAQTPTDDVGGAFKGALTGQLSVGPTGQTIYAVPIAIPPGVAGMAPNLNLVYSSQGLNGIAGQGWSLSGLSVIYRCPKTKTQDGFAKQVSMEVASVAGADDTSDGVCLDGNRLYGTGATRHGRSPFVGEFNDFSAITLIEPDNMFEVVTKSGERRSYGWNANAHVSFPREDSSGTKQSDQIVGVWALDRVEDVWGNFYEIHYSDAPSANGLMVSEIDYTGHEDANGVQDSQTFNSVRFDYESRPDTRTVRFRDSTMPANQRLKSITTDRGIYSLTYVDDSHSTNASDQYMLPSRLQQIGYCSTLGDPSTDCLKPLVFDWDGGGFSWVGAPDYALPFDAVKGIAGTQFVDLDGDGRLDVVYGRYSEARPGTNDLWGWRNTGRTTTTCSVEPGSTDCTWDNLGAAWEPQLYKSNGPMLANRVGVPQGTIFADFDGDGVADLITDSWIPTGGPAWSPNGDGVAWIFPVSGGALGDASMGIWGDAVGQALARAALSPPVGAPTLDWTKIDLKKDKVADINGDGRAEIIHFSKGQSGPGGPPVTPIFVLKWDGQTWQMDWSYSVWQVAVGNYSLCDLNRDGLPDLCGTQNMLNTGNAAKGEYGTVWKRTTIATPDPPSYLGTGDVDGDGQYDQVVNNGQDDPHPAVSRVSFAAGPGLSTEGADGYLASLIAHTDPPRIAYKYHDFLEGPVGTGRFELADLNADGLVDVVVNFGPCGRLLVNTGSTWVDLDPSFTTYQNTRSANAPYGVPVPKLPGNKLIAAGSYPWAGTPDLSLDAFLDLDGDGVPDRIMVEPVLSDDGQSFEYIRRAYLNRFRPPVIKGFPNGLAQNTTVEYAVITTASAKDLGTYIESGTPLATGDLATTYKMMPLRVAASVTADNGIGGTSRTTYQYVDLRGSASGHGPQGFGKIIVTDPTGMVTTTSFEKQGYPYTGKPTRVVRFKNGPISTTVTDYNHVSPPGPGTSTFIYPTIVTDTSYLQPDTPDPTGTQIATITTSTEYTYDNYGNPTYIGVTTTSSADGDSYKKETVNSYLNDGGDGLRRGKLTSAVVTTTQLASGSGTVATPTRHRTNFEYGPSYELKMKKVEPGAGSPIELWTAYRYDNYGNVTITTSCASDFEACSVGATNPGNPDDPQHPPFRTTWVSYDPAVFNPSPAGMTGRVTRLGYEQVGRFPVRTTNSLNQVQYSAYDPLFGTLIQSTGPNGIQTCTILDVLGWQTQEIARCGSSNELTTSINRYERATTSSPFVQVITKTVPPSGAYTQSGTDALGRVIETAARNFSGVDARTLTEYDQLGRVHRTSKPFFAGDARFWTVTNYDWLGRVSNVTQDLGDIGGVTAPASAVMTTSYKLQVIVIDAGVIFLDAQVVAVRMT